MAFRRSFKFRRNFHRKRPRLNWRKADSPQRWHFGNFNLHTFLQIDSESSPEGEFQAQLIASPHTFLPAATPSEIALIQAIRRIDIGGIVFTQGIDIVQAGNVVAGTLSVSMQQLWTVNQLDADGFAVGIDYPWGRNSQPVTNQPINIVENVDEPIRILDRHTENFDTADISAGIEGAQPIFRCRRSRSLRLKLPIDDKKVLCFTNYATRNQNIATTDELVIHFWVAGTIYYKYVH